MEKNIIVLINDIGQLKSMNIAHIYSLRKVDVCRQTNMTDLLIQLDDLPDEILMYIFKKLYNDEVLYSLMGVNQRLDRIVHDTIFTRRLSLLRYFSDDDDSTFPSPDRVLDRFCSKILPEIGHQIERLSLEQTSIGRVLNATNYPNLNDLGLCYIHAKVAMYLFAGKITFIVELISY
jgi:hypothetical protein